MIITITITTFIVCAMIVTSFDLFFGDNLITFGANHICIEFRRSCSENQLVVILASVIFNIACDFGVGPNQLFHSVDAI
jgi:hypothetical protein